MRERCAVGRVWRGRKLIAQPDALAFTFTFTLTVPLSIPFPITVAHIYRV